MNVLAPALPRAVARDAAPARKGLAWTADEDREIADLRARGLTAAAIAAIISRTPATVFTRLRKLGVVVQKHTPWTQADLAAGVAALESGLSWRAAAAAIGRTECELRWKVRDAGVAIPLRKRPTERRAPAPAPADGRDLIRADIAARKDTLAAIAARHGASRATVDRIAREIFPDRRYDCEPAKALRLERLARGREKLAAKPERALKWTKDRIAELAIRAADPAETDATLAAAFDSTPRMIAQILRDNGLRAPQRVRTGLDEPNKVRARALAEAGVAFTQTARILRVDPRTLRTWAASEGVVFRPADRTRAATPKPASITLAATKAAPAKPSIAARTPPAPKRAAAPSTALNAERRRRDIRAARAAEAARLRDARLAARAEAKAQATAEKERRKAEAAEAREREARIVEAKARTAKLDAMLAAARRRPAKVKKPTLDPKTLEAMVAAHISAHGVTRVAANGLDALVAAIRARGYAVTRAGEMFRIDAMVVPADELAAFAERRNIKIARAA